MQTAFALGGLPVCESGRFEGAAGNSVSGAWPAWQPASVGGLGQLGCGQHPGVQEPHPHVQAFRNQKIK